MYLIDSQVYFLAYGNDFATFGIVRTVSGMLQNAKSDLPRSSFYDASFPNLAYFDSSFSIIFFRQLDCIIFLISVGVACCVAAKCSKLTQGRMVSSKTKYNHPKLSQ